MTFLSCDTAIINIIIIIILLLLLLLCFSAVLCFMLSTIYGELKLFIIQWHVFYFILS